MPETMTLAEYRRTVSEKDKKAKYRNVKIAVENIVFDSKKEANRFLELKILERAGKISGLKLQPKIPIVVNGTRIGEYRADFSYVEDSLVKVEDVKSEATRKLPVYRLKKKLVKAIWGIEIIEI
jgi:hypothetical protein